MKHIKLIMLFCIGALFIGGKSFGQANPFINVLPSNSGIVAVGDTIEIIVTIGNSGPISTIPQAKLRPIIQLPPSVTFLPTASQVDLPAGWTILSNSGSQLRVCNSTDPIPVSTSRIIILKAQGVTVAGPQTFSGNINFGNGTTCAAGTSVAGDLITDNSATSTVQVTAFALDVLVDAPISCYGMSNGSIQAFPSVEGLTYTFTLNGGVATNTTGFFDNLGPGTYTVCASDGISSVCSNIALTEPAQLTASLSIDSTVSCLGNDGAISAQVSGGTASIQPLVLTWSAGVNASSIYATSVNGLAVGTYTVTVEDDNYCFTTATLYLPATSLVEVTASASPIVCFGGTTTIMPNSTGGTGAKSYSISGGTFTVTAGSYTITATDGKGCTATTTLAIMQPAQLVASSIAGSVDCNTSSTTVHVAAYGGTAPYTGTGSFTVNAGAYSYTVTDANGCTATTSGVVNSIPDMTNPTIYLQSSSLLPGVTGPSTTQTPYLLPQSLGGKFTSIFSVNDVVGTYRMVGIPDGLGAYDNNNGTFTLLMSHEIGGTSGIVRAHGSTGAFVSKWVINKSNLAVQSGSDLIQTVYTWDTATSSFVQGTTQFNRFCASDLPSVSAFYNQATGLGTQERIFMNGEESGPEGRAFGHILTGASTGVSYQLPYLGRFSWENSVASPASGDKTVVAGTDDNTSNGQVYFYIGTKTNSGTDIDKAGLNNGKLWGVKVPGLPSELSASIPAANTPFALEDLGFIQNETGATLNTNSVTAGVTNFLRPEDGAFDPSNPNDFYFVTTNSFTAPSRMWRLRFNDIANPETGGTITAVLDGTEGQKMLDNMAIDKLGHILLQEDPGGQAHSAKIWQYTIATDALELVGKHDPARFGDLVGSTTTPATLPFNNDEESSGIMDMSDILGPGMFLLDVQAHYTTGLPNLTEVVQGGQLLAFFNPASVSATASTAAADTINACSGTGVNLGTPATADNCTVASVTNNAPTTFPVGTTTVTWTVSDASGNSSTATQTVIVSNLVASSIAGSLDCNTSSTTIHVSATGGTAPYTGTGTFTVTAAGIYSYTVTDANGCTATTTAVVNSIPDTTPPTVYLQSSSLLPGVTGPSTTQTPYLLSQSVGGKFTSILSVNDVVGTYRMVGIPDGLGAYDNNNGTFTLLMSHEIGSTSGIVRAHGSTGAFVSKWVINKSNLAVQSGSDLIQTVYTWDTATSSFVQGTTQFNRFCASDLPSVSAFYNQATGLGTQERIFMNGEESGPEGRAFGHILTGASTGVSYQLPYLGRFSWENSVASPASGDKTVVAGTDDATPGQVYFYIGTKTNSGTDIDKAGLNNGKLWGVKVPGLPVELSASIPAANTPFVLEDLGFVQNTTGATLNTNSVNAGVTNFLRPEDGAFDPSNPNDFYFVTTNSFTAPSRMWRLRFNDIANPETGGTITAVLDGTEGQKMLDNMTIDKLGHILLQEDPGGQAHSAKIWQYTIATDALELVGKHDPARFGDLVGSTTTPATLPFNNDEESSGIIDMSDILGPGMFLLDVQAHYTTGLANLTEVVQGGQLLAFFNPASVSATASTANDTVFVSTTNCAGVSGVSLGTPATGDNCGVASVTNNAPSTFPLGNTAVTWTVTDMNGNTNTATQIVVVNYSSSGTTTATACDSYTWSSNGETYTTSGTYVHTYLNTSGCVHTQTLNLTVNYSSADTTTATACDAYTWSSNGQTYTTSGTYVHTFLNASGCVYTQTLNLSLGYTTYSTQNVTGLGSYQWSVNGTTYTQSGVYTHTLQNASGCDSILSLNLTINQGVNLSLKAFLGGAYDPQTGLMYDSLRNKQLIPLTELYSMPPFNRPQVLFAGGETVSPLLLSSTGPDAIVDWVYIEVRSGANAHQIIATKRALIQRDGDVVDTNGSTSIFLPGLATGQYFISLKHRNHLGIMTANAITLNLVPELINFTQPSYPVWVNAMITANPPRKISGSAALMITGDANFNKNVRYNGLNNDKAAVLAVVGVATPNNVVNGYRPEDVNMDGQVKYNNLNNDRSFIGVQIGVANPNLILSQHTPN